MDLNPPVHLKLTVLQVNQLLAIVAKEPLVQVIDLFTTIKMQGDMALMMLQQTAGSTTNGLAAAEEPRAEDPAPE